MPFLYIMALSLYSGLTSKKLSILKSSQNTRTVSSSFQNSFFRISL